ncbi:MAG TPA: hypothetical protein VM537_22820 [Anaerolineae bacterium]|nr:hypothetical protein [Anaerolineae bacterium]
MPIPDVNLTPMSDWDNLGNFFGGPMAPMIEEMTKALEAGAGVDAASYTGGRALGYESLEALLHSVTLTEDDAKLWRMLPKRSINATIDQFNRRTGYGGRWGMAVAESSNPVARISDLARAYEQVRFYRDYREVSDVSMMVHNTVNPDAEEEQAAITQLVHSIDEDLYWGVNSTANASFPLRVDGLFNRIIDNGTATVIDLEGAKLTSRDPFNQALALTRNLGGRITHAFMNPLLQEDFSIIYATAERVIIDAAGAGLMAGGKMNGVATAQGDVYFEGDPFNLVSWAFPAVALGNAATRPAAPTLNSATAGSTGGTIPSGDYYYRVTAVNEDGESTSVASGATTVTLGQTVTLDISPAASLATGFRIYRSEKDAASAADCRYQWVEVNAGANTTWVDDGSWIPGCAHVLLLDMRPQSHVLQWSQLLPASRKNLAQTGPTRPFLVNIYGGLRVAKPEWCGLIKNILPTVTSDDGWAPV